MIPSAQPSPASSLRYTIDEAHFVRQLRVLFQDRVTTQVDNWSVVTKIKLDASQPTPLHLFDCQLQLICLVSSIWRHESYSIVHLFSTYFEQVEAESLTHEIDVLVEKDALLSAECYTYNGEVLVSKATIVCQRN